MNDVPTAPAGLITHDNVWQFGILGVVCVGLIIALVWVVKLYIKTNDALGELREQFAIQVEKERNASAKERDAAEVARADFAKERAERETAVVKERMEITTRCAQERAEMSKQYAKDLTEAVASQRREFGDMLGEVTDSQAKVADRQVSMIEKLTDRITIVPPRGG